MADMGHIDDAGASVASVFEAIRHQDSEGGEHWSARELMAALEYTNWRNFKDAV